MTREPPGDVLSAFAAEDGDSDSPPSGGTQNPFLLCELGEHDTRTEHAAFLRAIEPPSAAALWFFWAGDGPDRVHRVDIVPWCPAVLRHLGTGVVRLCAFYDHHVAPHSWSVTDPLGDLIAERITSGEGPDDS
ncbi:hypothetical protein [Streptomyces sp. NPDC048142]|uniref:hypothetical protein n=1 Tax=Streptomyces sp. NPDC048142 TaxID=3365501 RepID=UPI0037180B7C